MGLLAAASEDRLVERRFIRPFRTISNGDVAVVGGKNASLGEMYAIDLGIDSISLNPDSVVATLQRLANE